MRRSLTPVMCALTLLAVAAVAAGPAIGQPTVADRDTAADATVVVASESVERGRTASVPVSLSAAPDGVAGYNVTIRVADPTTATIVGASVPDRYGLSETSVIDGGAAVVLRAADTSDAVTAGDEAIPLATVIVRGDTADQTELRVEIDAIDDDGGDRVDAGTDAGVFVVDGSATDTPTTTPSTSPPPTTTTRTSTTETTEPPATTEPTEPPATTETTEPPATTEPTEPATTTETTESTTTPGTTPDGTEPGDSTVTGTANGTDGDGTDDGGNGTPGPGPIGTVAGLLGGLELARRRRRSDGGD